MELHERVNDPPAAGTPEDVATLYSWANIRGLKYRDFSATRRARHRAPNSLRPESAPPRTPTTSRPPVLSSRKVEELEPLQYAGAADLAEARSPEPAMPAHPTIFPVNDSPDQLRLTPLEVSSSLTLSESVPKLPRGPVPLRYPRGYRPDDSSRVWRTLRSTTAPSVPDASERQSTAVERAQQPPVFGPETPLYSDPNPGMMGRALLRVAAGEVGAAESMEGSAASWLLAPSPPSASYAISLARSVDTLQDSRERMAARWYALNGVFDPALPALPALVPDTPGIARTPLLLVFSLAGGVGKTSLAATLGRTLSAQGERVLLADTTSHGLLPFYFGARELRDGVLRTFSAPEGSSDSPIDLVSYNMSGTGDDEPRQIALTERILGNAQGGNRLVLDLAQGTSWMVRRLAKLRPTVLVPLTPEMNSVISLQSVERLFHGVVDEDGRPLLPYYVLNQFDANLPLHLDVREVFRRQLGDRLLHRAIRRAPAIAEAQAEGMTVLDYAPNAAVVKDYFEIAAWLRRISPPAIEGMRARSRVSDRDDAGSDGSGE